MVLNDGSYGTSDMQVDLQFHWNENPWTAFPGKWLTYKIVVFFFIFYWTVHSTRKDGVITLKKGIFS